MAITSSTSVHVGPGELSATASIRNHKEFVALSVNLYIRGEVDTSNVTLYFQNYTQLGEFADAIQVAMNSPLRVAAQL